MPNGQSKMEDPPRCVSMAAQRKTPRPRRSAETPRTLHTRQSKPSSVKATASFLDCRLFASSRRAARIWKPMKLPRAASTARR
eukprot:2017942-Pyramimonas_sp.AAC.1